MAGINAVLKIEGKEPLILKRDEAKMSLEKKLALQYEMMRCRNGKISL